METLRMKKLILNISLIIIYRFEFLISIESSGNTLILVVLGVIKRYQKSCETIELIANRNEILVYVFKLFNFIISVNI